MYAIRSYYVPTSIKDDFDKLSEKAKIIMPKLKSVLDLYSTSLEGKYKTIFLQEKTKGFVKPIFDPNALKISSNKFPTNLAEARECK